MWIKSSYSDGTSCCVEVKITDTFVALRNSKDDPITGPRLTFTKEEWRAFVYGVECGEFNV